MALTPEEVVNQKFTITKFRDGYDLDQVDDFLDTIVEQFRQHEQEKAELQQQLDEANARVEELTAQLEQAEVASVEEGKPSEQTIVVDAPAQTATQMQSASGTNPADAVKSSAMLQLALELHDKYVHEGETQRDLLVNEAETKAKRLVEEAQLQRAEELRILGEERQGLKDKIKELREFESDYRGTLRSYIQSQLRGLDGSPEPDGAPQGLE
ncbi:DivIVA domain-containing protein [Leucobacter sp. Z1108]|uniref:DivIVA domain-containing protein n=1 Tax=unclassified Leucobacter TaxID=2621730 RepID=UPI003D96FB75